MQAFAEIAATGSDTLKAQVRMLAALETADWLALLRHSQVDDVDKRMAKVFEIRALGELGCIDDMVLVCQRVPSALRSTVRVDCRLMLLSFFGRVEAVNALLDGKYSATEPDIKAYWIATARLQVNAADAVGRSALKQLSDSATPSRLRLAASRRLAFVESHVGTEQPAVSDHTDQKFEDCFRWSATTARTGHAAISVDAAARWRHNRKIYMRVVMILLAIAIAITVMENVFR